MNPNRLAPVGIHYTYLNDEDLAAFNKLAERRGLKYLGCRFASTEEMNNEGFGGYRIGFGTYLEWTKLINDEKKLSENQEWFNKLKSWEKQYPQFESKS